MSWKMPASIRAALDEANVRWPKRSRISDGTIGDQAHSSRYSDHNVGARGYIHAFDLTNDPANGCDCVVLAEHLRLTRDPRVSYVIWNRRIWNPSRDIGWRPYSGSNPHDKHMHVSIKSTIDAERNTNPWWEVIPPMSEEDDDMGYRYEAIRLASGEVALWAPGHFKHVSEEEWTIHASKKWCQPKAEATPVNQREWDVCRAVAFGGEEPEAARAAD